MEKSFVHEFVSHNINSILKAYKCGELNEIEKELEKDIIQITQNLEIAITKRLIIRDFNEVKRICSYAIENPKEKKEFNKLYTIFNRLAINYFIFRIFKRSWVDKLNEEKTKELIQVNDELYEIKRRLFTGLYLDV